MLEENLEEGLELAKEAYELYPDGTYARDTYMIALHANGFLEEAQTDELAVELITFQDFTNPLNLILGWHGFSILMHAFPSTQDAKVMVERILSNSEVAFLWKILAAPFVGLIYIGAVGSVFWLDFIYAAGMGMLVPNLIVHILS